MTDQLGFIGGGNMSTAIIRGILKSGVYSASNIVVSGPHISNLQHLKDLGIKVTTDNKEVVATSDIVFLGIKPHLLSVAINQCIGVQKSPEKDKLLFVSMLAGVTLTELQKAIQILDIPTSVIRIMPNITMSVGAGVCLVTPDSSVDLKKCKVVKELLGTSAICEEVPETLIDSLGALTGCGPAFMFIVIEALADGAVKQGVPRATALRLAAQTVVGSGRMVLETGKHPGLLKDEVCSPGGATICGVATLEEGKLRATLINAIEASTLKTKQLGKQ